MDFEVKLQKHDGTVMDCLLTASIQADLDGTGVRRIQGVVRDITEHKLADRALRDSEERLRTLTRLSPAMIFHANPDGECVYVNERWTEITGLPMELALGLGWMEGVYGPDREECDARWNETIDGLAPWTEVELRFQHVDGKLTWLLGQVEAEKSEGGEVISYVGSLIDITELKEAEEALRQYAEDLARSNSDLQQFAYVASHDLQEPLRMVSSYTQLLARRYKDRLDADADEFIGYAVDGAARMQTLINDLLDYSRLGTPEGSFEAVDCNGLLDQVVADLRPNTEGSGGEISYADLPTVNADRPQLAQVFQNLIGNAIKFRGEEPPSIQVSAGRLDGAWVFSVSDNGIGIEPEYADRIFVIFQRLVTREQYPGTGIGLAICKKIVENHGGRIWFESEPGKGTTFFFSLSVAEGM